jgi:Dynein heavy chain, N-terminal region 2
MWWQRYALSRIENSQSRVWNVQMEWGEIKCETVEWRDTGTRILRSPDQAQALLEDHLMKLGSMRASPYISHFLERLLMWDRKLNVTQVPFTCVYSSPPGSPQTQYCQCLDGAFVGSF